MSPGEVAKRYKATIQLLLDYSKRQRLILQQYKQFSDQLQQQQNDILTTPTLPE